MKKTEDSSKIHVGWIDAYKGVLIILVVLGHVIGGGIHLMPEGTFSRTVAEYAFKFIYSFHMPAFFLIAGVTFGMGRRKTFSEFLGRKAQRLLVPYFFFGIASGVLYLALSGYFDTAVANHATDSYYAGKTGIAWWVPFVGLLHGGGWPNGLGFISNSVLWFLPCLFSVEIAYYLLDWSMSNQRGQLLIAGLLLLVVQPLGCLLPQELPWGFSKLPYFLPFMVMGRWMPAAVRTSRVATIIGATLLVALAGGVIATPNAWYATQNWRWSLIFTGLAIMGVVSLSCLIRFADFRMVRLLGMTSMTIMLLHKFLVVAMQLKIPVLRALSSAGGWRMAIATGGITAVSLFICVGADWFIRTIAPWMLGMKSSAATKLRN